MTASIVPHNPPTTLVVNPHDLHDSLTASVRAAERVLWPEAYAALDEAEAAVICDLDCVSGDQHVYTPAEQWEAEEGPIGALELAMLDSCLGSLPELQAACLLVELEQDGVFVTPVACGSCGRTHLKAGR